MEYMQAVVVLCALPFLLCSWRMMIQNVYTPTALRTYVQAVLLSTSGHEFTDLIVATMPLDADRYTSAVRFVNHPRYSSQLRVLFYQNPTPNPYRSKPA